MSEQPDPTPGTAQDVAQDESSASTSQPPHADVDWSPMPTTGNEQVDAVLSSVDSTSEKPVDEHVAVFERAHEDLRRALDDSGRA